MEPTQAWQCVGCGRLECQATCIGICHDVPVKIVSYADYVALEAQAESLKAELHRLRLFVRQLAHVSPRAGAWQRVYGDLQSAALRLLDGEDSSRTASASAIPVAVSAKAAT